MSQAVELMSAVMNDVRALGKGDRNKDQGFMFRGIDSVMNAVGPALRDQGIVVQSQVLGIERDSYTTKSGTVMSRAVVTVEYRFTAPDDSYVAAQSYGEAADAGDKCVSKAMSVAYRTVIIQTLCLPTNEADPDETSHERVADRADAYGPGPQVTTDPKREAFAYLRSIVQIKGLNEDEVPFSFRLMRKKDIATATPEEIKDYAAYVQTTGELTSFPTAEKETKDDG